ncbi:type II CAAX endopeptidase family protein [Fredinandcohnia sp. QZ13]|uniref:CPBP family intramembrane glutamic endopeptidase n=1 Tax=Fredinandcohnia sp. QZ13 TaxID=3073144 RepID=UPI0028534D5C|nr:type II CAAX endopeptidase family protein [Fredinandcohnia sp. QZ13]MDR4886899.1 type II CAAX endopeptidase family protein [Fredinandcohnia sp. QZ13]
MHKNFFLLFILVHILLAISFLSDLPFWIMFTISFFLLSIAAIRYGKFDTKTISITNLAFAILSGLLMYGLFFTGKISSELLFPNVLTDVSALYMKVQPQLTWHYMVLFLIIIPGEELFWRGFIQKKVEDHFENKLLVIVISSLLYMSANLYTFNPLFLLATFAGGVVWGTLYMWNRNILLTILSHLVFNLFFLVLFPIF